MASALEDRWAVPHLSVAVAVLCAVALITGCDNQIPAFERGEDGFSIFGVFNPDSTGQVLRVERLQDNIRLGTYPEIRETVRLVDRSGGRSWELEGRVVRDTVDEQSVFYHEFLVPDVLRAGRSYLLVVTGPDGITSRADVTIPARPNIAVEGTLDMCHTGEPLEAQERQVRSNAAIVEVATGGRISKATAFYEERYGPPNSGLYPRTFESYTRTVEKEDGAYRIEVNPEEDLFVDYGSGFQRLTLPERVVLDLRIAGSEWPGLDYDEGTVSDVSDHTAFSTVEDGVGVVYAFIGTRVVVPQDGPTVECED